MNPLDLDSVEQYVHKNILDFHERRVRSLKEMKLKDLLTKNPYLFRAKNVLTAPDLIYGLLDARLSSSEEKLFGDFLEGLAVFVAEQTSGGHKSTASGVDLEFINRGTHYVVSVKSGPNWGNASQHNDLERDLRVAAARVKQGNRPLHVEPVVGICYGKTRTTFNKRRGYWKVVGQNFWYLVSEDKNLYTEIIEPLGHRAKEHNESFDLERSLLTNRLVKAFIDDFCYDSGAIDWIRLVQFNSGNYNPAKVLPGHSSS